MLRSHLAYNLIATQVASIICMHRYFICCTSNFPSTKLSLTQPSTFVTRTNKIATCPNGQGRLQPRTRCLGFNDPANQPWALKDPRLCVTLKFWLPFWTKPPSILFVYRHPVEVALSLSRLNETGGARGMYMWIAHNRLAIQNSQGLCRVVTSDADLIQDGPGTLYMV